MVVARMRVPAAAIGAPFCQRLVVVPRDRDDPELVQDRMDLPGIRTEAAEITEAEERRRPSQARILRGRSKREVIVVRAAEERDRPFQAGIVEEDGCHGPTHGITPATPLPATPCGLPCGMLPC